MYLYLKAIHIIAVISWMAGMFYLPRLYVYHTTHGQDKKTYAMFCLMERRLLRIIINPAMILTFVTGIWLIFDGTAVDWSDGWLHAKIFLVILMAIVHSFFARWRRYFAKNDNKHSAKFYRIMNEVPTVLMIAIVFIVVFKPW